MSTIQAAVDAATHFEIQSFLFHEAELLDDNRIREWFELLTEDVDYKIPVRITRERSAGPGFSTEAFHMDEDHGMLETRVDRLETEYAWAEDPPSRTRRLVGNVRVQATDDPNELLAKSNLLLFRSRYDVPAYQLLACERQDVLRRVDDEWRLARRVVLLDQSTLATHNLAIFL